MGGEIIADFWKSAMISWSGLRVDYRKPLSGGQRSQKTAMVVFGLARITPVRTRTILWSANYVANIVGC